MDFEATCKGSIVDGEHQGDRAWNTKNAEIIEFPAILLDASTRQVVSEFREFVQPTENPTLSRYCKSLTSITQRQVADAQPLEVVLESFSTWLLEQTGPATALPVTCGDWDLKMVLPRECQRKGIRIPQTLEKWVNIKKVVSDMLNIKRRDLAGMLEDLQLPQVGRPHVGIDDCRSIVTIVCCLMSQHSWVPVASRF
jgi:inhibitor of KinA sporulation pathway (predicted exonuclease)